MIVTIHQPNFFPWLGFFDKFVQADIMVFLDNVPFTKGGFQNRVKLANQNDIFWLTAPVVTKGQLGQLTNSVLLDTKTNWRRTHLKTIHHNYSKSERFDEVFTALEHIYSQPNTLLSEFNITAIEAMAKILGIRTKTIKASSLNAKGDSSQLLANIVEEVGGTTYLSGPSGRSYLTMNVFEERNISVNFHSYTAPTYHSIAHRGTVSGLSVLDYVFSDPHLEIWKKDIQKHKRIG